MCVHREKAHENIARRQRSASSEDTPERTKPLNILILNCQSPQLWENKFLFKSPVWFCYGSPSKLIHPHKVNICHTLHGDSRK